MQITQTDNDIPGGQEVTLTISGRLNIYQAGELKECLLTALHAGKHIRIDMLQVTECDVIGLQVILSAVRSAAARSLSISLTNLSDAVAQAMARAGINAI